MVSPTLVIHPDGVNASTSGGGQDPYLHSRQNVLRVSVGAIGFGLMMALMWLVGGALGVVRWYEAVAPPLASAGSLVVGAVLWFLTRSKLTNAQVHTAGLISIVLFSSVSAVAHALHTTAIYGQVTAFGPSILVLAVFPLALPSSPRRTLLTSVASIALNLSAIWATTALGYAQIQAFSFFDLVALSAAAATLSYAAAHVLARLQKDANEARKLGAYELEELLGEGGMGQVWRARHRLIKRKAAIKLIRNAAELENTNAFEENQRFYREALATAALESVHTVRLFDFGVTQDGTLYFVMELLEGMHLGELVREHGPQPHERVIAILKGVCDSLAEAHARGLVHRDIKPANIMLVRQGRTVDVVKVLDFGIVSLQPEMLPDGSEPLPDGNAMVGTPAFMAPEAIRGDPHIDGRADLYSLGCVAYWLLCGRKLFSEKTVMSMVAAHLNDPVIPPSSRGIALPHPLEALVLQLLEKDPADRPSSAEEVLERLDALEGNAAWSEAHARDWWRHHGPEEGGTTGPLRVARGSLVPSEEPARPSSVPPQWRERDQLDHTGVPAMGETQLDVTRAD